jgi:hypothetical protein
MKLVKNVEIGENGINNKSNNIQEYFSKDSQRYDHFLGKNQFTTL